MVAKRRFDARFITAGKASEDDGDKGQAVAYDGKATNVRFAIANRTVTP